MKTLITVAALTVLSTVAFAQMPPMLTSFDKDSSGTLSMDEIKAAMPNATEADMMKYDANSDKAIDQDEYTKMIEMIGK